VDQTSRDKILRRFEERRKERKKGMTSKELF